MRATEKDIAFLDGLYSGRRAFFGELHDHAKTGGTSDGQRTLEHWKGAMEALKMDFGTILDHKQVRHMYLPEWEDGTFIGGTEPGANILDIVCQKPNLHYNMIFAEPAPLEALLEEFQEYRFTGGKEGHFIYPGFTTPRFCELIDAVKAHGGFFVHPHPKQQLISDDPLHYWYRDETGIEVFYTGDANNGRDYTAENYELWTTLLAMGKRLWACAGGDGHACADDRALTTIYAEEKKNASYIFHLREGDFTAGAVGIKMCIGDMKMGGICGFDGKRLVLSVGDFHVSVADSVHKYCVKLLSDEGEVFSEEVSCTEPAYFAIDVEDKKFYRAEVYDLSRGKLIALGNPIWNEKYYD
ncbi:MAG: hypothetical protein IJ428_03655 [Clostridia bacterium]|nr:hypothetical protein [Clostridia bacterium]